jgi:hypothetical protein
MTKLMITLLRTQVCAALASGVFIAAIASAQQEPPPRDPTRPTVVNQSAPSLPRDLVVRASLRQPAQPPEPQGEFSPVDDLPPEEQLAAWPLLVSAYAFVLLAMFGYLLSVAKRLGVVQREIVRLESELKKSGRT